MSADSAAAVPMAQRRHAPIARHQTRAYRLTRTAALALSLVVGGVWVAHHGEPAPPAGDGPRFAKAAADPAGDSRGPASPRPASPRPASPQPVAQHPVAPRPVASPHPLPPSPAVSLAVPYLGIKAPVVALGLDAHRHLATPPVDNPKVAGWYQGGPSPGELGTAVAVGHLDTRVGAAVFAGLKMLHPGRLIEVRRADGKIAVYTVDRIKTYAKARFPDKEVYGPTGRPELRLITCAGRFNAKTGYESNLVVFAHLTDIRTTPARPPEPQHRKH
ncbi:class F sortase [Streptomyces violascens]|uniref:class F sortase n=1 Tax=Streptomyces violascens TaxID=67381 RepID=UPI00364F6EF2